ncbi:amidase [Coccomyxa subellipsoidea C-169]|uniref:Amidase n=1 Tax=Coccomyxa subellipsoidea (strain C-169) TaxID=574566 RepID=I0YW81_COCSC|nr:amidase [Coccomyxa subellipsoidea C-169]EIE22650.1 amidase [Coccomyxa subellipsoidea C-169]|eukprot:XP_005647194.1 amidase [Coccomyxa subellipsoidea C-169]
MSRDSSNAFLPDGPEITGAAEGPLQGLTFAAKDLYDVENYVTGFGNPTWKETHEPATATAPAVQALLSAGASLVGKTHMDELAYSLNGENFHYGTPVNPACPDRIPGGSSSGSVVAVANESVDIALGSDTGGSVRVPASYCGAWGIRPTHGRVSLEGACTLAASYDTGGFFARNAELLRRAGDVLLDPATRSDVQFKRWLVAKDAFDLADDATSEAIFRVGLIDLVFLDSYHRFSLPVACTTKTASCSEGFELACCVFRVSQGAEVWEALGEWVQSAQPQLGPGTKERFEMASQLTTEEVARANELRARITQHLEQLLGEDGVLAVPSAPGPAPFLNTPQQDLDTFRKRLISLTCIAGLSGLPQVSLPVAKVEGCPVGLGLIGPRGSDEALLRLTEQLEPVLVRP